MKIAQTTNAWGPMGTLCPVPFEPRTVAAHFVKQSHRITMLEIRRLQDNGGAKGRCDFPYDELTLAELRILAGVVVRQGFRTIVRRLGARPGAQLPLRLWRGRQP